MSDEAKHPWIKGGLRITRAVIERVDEEARAAFGRDEESCGLLLGPSGDALLVDEVVPMENRANKLHRLDPETYPRTGRMYFDIDPLKFERAVTAGESSGRPVKVLYHSHLDVGAYFSDTDAAAATMGGEAPTYDLAYLVTSVRAGVGGGATIVVDDAERSGAAEAVSRGYGGGATIVVDDRKLFVWDAARRRFEETTLTLV